jgi:SAM-dependent methyltransferase
LTVDPRSASAFGPAAHAYERARPSYPPEAVARLAQRLGVGPRSTVVDLAAGTGKLTRVLHALPGTVIAVEPSAGMRAMLARVLPDVEVRDGTAESLPVPDGSVDAVFVGEAFHWFRMTPAGREIARALRPGGGLALLWNRDVWRPEETGPWLEELRAFLRACQPTGPRYRGLHGGWREPLAALDVFTEFEREDAEQVHELDGRGFVELTSSWSWVANLPSEERRELLERVHALVGDGPLRLRFRTGMHWAFRR